ncbi:MAG: prepilin-type N-terminal cleavage/methylation domain-containing protein [Synergistaceae bacterium]|nr:prepilin-type N-terminal cleavage/methylation domain-containing protein [Synergistaceae bacterium]
MSYRKNTRRKGFTLVELLIVIVVISILSAMMMMSSNEAVSSAKANNIIANLRNLKTAALAWYADNPDLFTSSYEGIGKVTTGNYKSSNHNAVWPNVKKYLSSGSTNNNTELDTNYTLVWPI